MLLSGKSLKHDFIRFVSATMVSQVVFSLYSMVDGLMVSIGVNEYAMSAVNLAIPFTNALFSIAVLFAVGSSTLIAIFIAQEKRREANALFSQNFATLLEMLNTMQVSEEDEDYQNPVDLLFDDPANLLFFCFFVCLF